MRRLFLLVTIVPLLTGCFYLPGVSGSDSSGSSGSAAAESNVRSAIPAIEAWYADHGTYAGITLAALRTTYDAGLPDVVIVKADAKTYCIESAVGDVSYFKAGPAANVFEGHCGDAVTAPAPPPLFSCTGQTCVRAAIPAIEAWYADHGTYARMTIAKLRKYDYSIPPMLKIVWATKQRYCVESSVNGETYSYRGPGGPLSPGGC
jgi:hypothetical protein